MKTARRMRLMIVLTALSLTASSAAAQSPGYLILRAPAADQVPPAGHHAYPPAAGHGGYAYPVQPRGYSYGWFGAQPHRQWSRHFGYYRNYTQWSAR